MGYNFRTLVFCPRCFFDVEEEFGFLEWKHWKYCPECGSKLVQVPIENRPEEYKHMKKLEAEEMIDWIEVQPGLFVDPKNIFERLKECEKDDYNRDKS